MGTTLKIINDFLAALQWCDFEVLEYNGNLKIGGKTSFSNIHEIVIIFENVYYFQCLTAWTADTTVTCFTIPVLEERRDLNIKYQIQQGNTLFKIIGEDVAPMYVSAENITVEFRVEQREVGGE